MRHGQGIARIGNQPCQSVGGPQAVLGSRQQHDAAIRGEASAVEVGDDPFAAHGWKQQRRVGIVGTWRAWLGVIGERDAFDTQSVSTISSLHDPRYRTPARP